MVAQIIESKRFPNEEVGETIGCVVAIGLSVVVVVGPILSIKKSKNVFDLKDQKEMLEGAR